MSGLGVKRILAVLIILVGAGGLLAFGPGTQNYTVKLDFTNADGLVVGNKVTVAGVDAGSVDGLKLQGNVAVVSVSLNPQFAPLHGSSRALIRSLGLLGNKYVEIIPGDSKAAEVPTGSEITIDSTTSPTDLDQFNAIFDAPTRDKIKTLTLEGQISLGGRAQVLNRDLAQLRNLAEAAAPFTGVLDDKQVALDRATVAFDTFTQKLVLEDASLRGFIEHGGSVLTAIQQHDTQLAGLLSHGDSTFTRLDSILNGNESSLAGFFARQPSVLKTTDYTVTAGIPVVTAAQPLIQPLDLLFSAMQDASVGISTGGSTGDPNNANSGAIWALRPMAVVCDTLTPDNSSC